MTSIDPLSFGDEVDLYHLTDSGGAVVTSFEFSLIGGGNHAVVWRPPAPHAATGNLLYLGAIGRESASAADEINEADTVIGTSCTHNRFGSPARCITIEHEFV